MEFNPHGSAHTSFILGFINDVGTAARDPLFFMLHANVDRLWAKWQWIHKRRIRRKHVHSQRPAPTESAIDSATRCGHGTA